MAPPIAAIPTAAMAKSVMGGINIVVVGVGGVKATTQNPSAHSGTDSR